MGATEFRSLSVSIGAFPFGSLRSNGALWRVFICLLFLDPVFSVTCFTCKDSIAGCPGGDQCPLITDLADNVELFRTGSLSEVPKLTNLLPPDLRVSFPRAVCEAIIGIASAPVGGTTIDFTDAAYTESDTVVKAAFYQHCTFEEASLELCRRVTEATEQLEVSKLKSLIEMLGAKSKDSFAAMQGVYTFIWGKITAHVTPSQTIRLVSNGDSAKKSDFIATIKRPTSAEQFFEMLFYWIFVVCSLGLAPLSLVMDFVRRSVFDPMRTIKISWQTAHELFLVFLKQMETDTKRLLNFSNVTERRFDTCLGEAKVNSAVFFRTRGGEPQPGSAGAWNGTFDAKASKPCINFNLGRPCTKLDANGRCKFNHICNQFVSDKGKGGICGSCSHGRSECDYDSAKKRSTPQP